MTRLRTTALPTRRPTTKPTRAGPLPRSSPTTVMPPCRRRTPCRSTRLNEAEPLKLRCTGYRRPSGPAGIHSRPGLGRLGRPVRADPRALGPVRTGSPITSGPAEPDTMDGRPGNPAQRQGREGRFIVTVEHADLTGRLKRPTAGDLSCGVASGRLVPHGFSPGGGNRACASCGGCWVGRCASWRILLLGERRGRGDRRGDAGHDRFDHWPPFGIARW